MEHEVIELSYKNPPRFHNGDRVRIFKENNTLFGSQGIIVNQLQKPMAGPSSKIGSFFEVMLSNGRIYHLPESTLEKC